MIAVESETLIDKISQTKTLEGGSLVYEKASIGFIKFWPDEVRPTSKYVLTSNLDFIVSLRANLLSMGVDIMNLYRIEEHGDSVVAPPLVEWDQDYKVPLIVDGIHRFWLARQLGIRVTSIYVMGADNRLPVIGLPLSWDQVNVLDSLPISPAERRDLRPGIKDKSDCLRRYYRDLSYLGSLGRRPSGLQVA